MRPIIRRFSCPTRNKLEPSQAVVNSSTAGYALIVVMIAVTVLAIALLTVVPSTYQESRREKEEELIFRGNQFARAIYLFQQKFQRYPASIKELLHTNNLSFLRRPWRDPMTPGGKWRFIHATAGGGLLDSWTLSQPPGAPPLGQAGQAGAAGNQSSFGSGGMPSGMSQTQGAFGTSQGGGFSLSNTSGSSSSPQPGQPGSPASGRPTDASGKPIQSPDCAGAGQSGPTSAFFASGNQPQGAAIAGVASCSDATSLRTYNKYTQYSMWEFLGVGFNPALGAGITPPPPSVPITTPSGPGGNQGQPGQGGPAGMTSPAPGAQGPALPGPPEMPAPGPEPPAPPDGGAPPQP